MEANAKNIELVVRDTISKMSGIKPDEINPDAHFVKDLGIDSINVVELTVALEKSFGVGIDDMVIAKLNTINATTETVLKIIEDNKN